MSDAPQEPTAESLEVIRKFAETYAQRTGTYFCADPSVTSKPLALSKNPPSSPASAMPTLTIHQ